MALPPWHLNPAGTSSMSRAQLQAGSPFPAGWGMVSPVRSGLPADGAPTDLVLTTDDWNLIAWHGHLPKIWTMRMDFEILVDGSGMYGGTDGSGLAVSCNGTSTYDGAIGTTVSLPITGTCLARRLAPGFTTEGDPAYADCVDTIKIGVDLPNWAKGTIAGDHVELRVDTQDFWVDRFRYRAPKPSGPGVDFLASAKLVLDGALVWKDDATSHTPGDPVVYYVPDRPLDEDPIFVPAETGFSFFVVSEGDTSYSDELVKGKLSLSKTADEKDVYAQAKIIVFMGRPFQVTKCDIFCYPLELYDFPLVS